jgi:hypothetical protein
MSREYTNNTPLRTLPQNAATPNTNIRRKCHEVGAIANRLQKQIADEKAKNDDLQDQIHALQKELSAKKQEVTKQKETIAVLRHENYNSVEKNVYETLKKDNNDLSEELSRMKSHVLSLEKMKKDHEEEMESFRNEMAALTDELEKSNRRTAELDDVKTERDFFVEQCRKFQDRLTISEKLREQEVKTLQQAYEEKIQSLQERIDELTENELSMSGEHIIMHQEPEPVPESLSVVNEIMYNELVDDVETLKSQYEEQLKELHQTVDQKNGLLREQSDRISSLEADLTASAKTVNQLSHQLEQLVQVHEDKISDQVKVVDEKDESIRLLNEQLQVRDSQIRDLQKGMNKLSADMKEKDNLIHDQVIGLSEMRDMAASKEQQIDDLRSKIETLNQIIAALNDKVASHEALVLSSRKEFDSMSVLIEEKATLIQDLNAQLSAATDAVASKDNQIKSLEKIIAERKQELDESRAELKHISSELIAKIDAGDAKFDELHQQLLKQMSECRDKHETELMRVMDELKSSESRLTSNQEAELKDMWNLVIEKDAVIAKLNDKVKTQEASLQSSRADLQSFSSKMEEMSRSRNDQIIRLEDEIRELRKSRSEVQSGEIQRLNEHLKRSNEMLIKSENEKKQLREDLQIMEQSFEMERAQKKRYQRECCDLEKKLDSRRHENTGNNTYIMPTINIQSGASGQDAAAAAAIVNSLSQSHSAANSTFDAGRNGRRPLPGTSFFVADEPSEVMNSSFISTNEDPYERFSALQERNRKQPPHLKSCYAAEHQEVVIPENEIRGVPDRQILAAMSRAGPNQTFSITDTTTHTRTFQ